MRANVMFKKLFRMQFIAILLVSALVFTGCTSKSKGSSYTVTMWVFPFGSDPNKEKDMWDKMIKGFETNNPGLKVNIQTLPWANREQKMMTALAANKGPDIVYMNPDIMKMFSNNNVLLPLDSYITTNDIKNDIIESALNEVKVNGKTYGVPILIDILSYVYNLDTLKEIGMNKNNLPATYNEYEQMLKKLKEKGKYGTYIQLGNSAINNGLFAQLYSEGNDVITPDGKVVIDNDAGKKVMTRLVNWYKEGYMPKDSLNVNNALSSFVAGNVASFHTSGTSNLKTKEMQEAKFDWAVGPVLKGDKGTFAASTVGSLSITKDSKNPNAAFKWIEWVTNKENMKTFCEFTGFIAPRKSVGDLSKGVKGTDVVYGQLQYARGEINHPAARQATPLITPALQSMVTGTKSVDVGLTDLKKAIEEVVNQINEVSNMTK